MSRRLSVLVCTLVAFAATVHAARLTLVIDGDNRTPYDASRGKAGRAEWTAAVTARKGAILTDDFQGVNIDVPADTATSVGHFSVFFSQTGGYPAQAGNTAPQKHPTGVFVGRHVDVHALKVVGEDRAFPRVHGRGPLRASDFAARRIVGRPLVAVDEQRQPRGV